MSLPPIPIWLLLGNFDTCTLLSGFLVRFQGQVLTRTKIWLCYTLWVKLRMTTADNIFCLETLSVKSDPKCIIERSVGNESSNTILTAPSTQVKVLVSFCVSSFLFLSHEKCLQAHPMLIQSGKASSRPSLNPVSADAFIDLCLLILTLLLGQSCHFIGSLLDHGNDPKQPP